MHACTQVTHAVTRSPDQRRLGCASWQCIDASCMQRTYQLGVACVFEGHCIAPYVRPHDSSRGHRSNGAKTQCMHARDAHIMIKPYQHNANGIHLSFSRPEWVLKPGAGRPSCSFKDSYIRDKPWVRRRAVTRKLVAKAHSPTAHACAAQSARLV